MENWMVSVGAALIGIVFAYIVGLLFLDVMNFPVVMAPIVLMGIVIGLLVLLILKLNKVLAKLENRKD